MIDLKYALENYDAIEKKLHARDPSINLELVRDTYYLRKDLIQQEEFLRSEQNASSQLVKDLNGAAKDAKVAELRQLSDKISSISSERKTIDEKLNALLLDIPNIIQDDVPISSRKEDSVIVKEYGHKPSFDFMPADHADLVEKLGLVDFARASKIATKGFPMYTGKGAALEFALIQYMIKHHTSKGLTFILPPILNNTATLTNGGNLPKFAEQIYSCRDDDLHIIPTSEVPLTSMYSNEVIDLSQGPLRFFAYTPNFRREAGTYGKRDRGLMRIHQFNKVETYSICKPEESQKETAFLVSNATELLDDLELHYRVANLPSCDLAHQSSQTFDIEIWLPTQSRYSEVSSGSNCTDFQARRANIKYTTDKNKEYVHTINCSGLATPRLLVALLETNQTQEGGIKIPKALQPFTGFDYIKPKE
jgi:seryl-tRNA synthetase